MVSTAHLEHLYSKTHSIADDSLTYRTVEDTEELQEAMELVTQKYMEKGYISDPKAHLKQFFYHSIPTTTTFIAEHKLLGIVGTLTLIEDSEFGLPMDELYHAELNQLRKQRRHLAEASMLAIDIHNTHKQGFPRLKPDNFLITLNLFKEMFDYTRVSTPTTELVACVNPKHEVLYDFLHFQNVGKPAAYPAVNGHLAVGKQLNILQTQSIAKHYPVLRFFYSMESTKRFDSRLRLDQQSREAIFSQSQFALA